MSRSSALGLGLVFASAKAQDEQSFCMRQREPLVQAGSSGRSAWHAITFTCSTNGLGIIYVHKSRDLQMRPVLHVLRIKEESW